MAIPYDAEKHLLLCDQAHKRRINVDTPEYSDYLTRLRDYQYDPFREDKRLELFQVFISEWPPVKRSPLQMMFGVKVGGSGEPVDLDPFAEKPWKGIQWAVERNFWTQRGTMELAKEMVPLDENDDPYRMAYQWQCAIFDPKQHVVIRYWCKENGVDIVEFFKEFLPAHPDLQIIETTNPKLLDEMANGGSYAPTRRSIPVEQLPILGQLIGKTIPATQDGTPHHESGPLTGFTLIDAESQTTVADLIPGLSVELSEGKEYAIRADYNREYAIGSVSLKLAGPKNVSRIENVAPFSLYGDTGRRLHGKSLPAGQYVLTATAYMGKKAGGAMMEERHVSFIVTEKKATRTPEPQPEPAHQEREQPGPTSVIWEGTKAYSPDYVARALRKALGRDFDLFGGQISDSKIVAIQEQAMRDFLQSDDTDRGTYVLDTGKRNYDCDNFADTLRNALNRKYGLNCVGIVWGNNHAWNFFVVVAGVEPKIVFVEPQDDVIVTSLSAEYSVSKRCAVYL